jgi:hypothetical protein
MDAVLSAAGSGVLALDEVRALSRAGRGRPQLREASAGYPAGRKTACRPERASDALTRRAQASDARCRRNATAPPGPLPTTATAGGSERKQAATVERLLIVLISILPEAPMVILNQQPAPRRARRDDPIALPSTWVVARITGRTD